MVSFALATVLITGLLNTWDELGGSLNALWDTAYGQILIIKVLLVFDMMDLGAINRYSFLPQLQTWAKCP